MNSIVLRLPSRTPPSTTAAPPRRARRARRTRQARQARLHFTLAIGDITSKEGAARHALETFPGRWHRVIEEALRIRRADRALPTLAGLAADVAEFLPSGSGPDRRSLYPTPWARRRDVLAFAGMVIADAHRLHAARRE